MSELRNRSSQHDKHENDALARFSEIIKCVSDMVTDQIVRVMNWHLIKQLQTHAMSSIVDELSTLMQDYCLVDKIRNSDSQNADQAKYSLSIALSLSYLLNSVCPNCCKSVISFVQCLSFLAELVLAQK